MGAPSPGAGGAGQPVTTPSGRHKKIKLVDPAKLRELIKDLDELTPAQKRSMEDRWLRYVLWWNSRASRAKWKYHLLRGTVVIGSAAVPVLLALSQMKQLSDYTWQLTVTSISVSFLVAVCAGLESLFGFGDTWREKRDACELIKEYLSAAENRQETSAAPLDSGHLPSPRRRWLGGAAVSKRR